VAQSTRAPSNATTSMYNTTSGGMRSGTLAPFDSKFTSARQGSMMKSDMLKRETSGSKSYSYDEDFLVRMCFELENMTHRLEVEQRRLSALDEGVKRARNDLLSKYTRKNQRPLAERKRRTKAKLIAQRRMSSVKGWLADAVQKLNYYKDINANYKMAIDRYRLEGKHLDKGFENLKRIIQQNALQFQKHSNVAKEIQDVMDQRKESIAENNQMLKTERQQWKMQITNLSQLLRGVQRDQKREQNEKLTRMAEFRRNKGKYMVADEEEQFSEPLMYRHILKCAFLNCIQRKHIKQHQRNIKVFEQAFATIKTSTGISCIEQIVHIFTKLEERHFSLLTYINQLNKEMEQLEVANREMLVTRNKMDAQNDKTRVQRKLSVNNLEDKLERTLKETTVLEEEQQLCDDIIENCVKIMENVVRQLNEDEEEPLDIPKEGRSRDNLEKFLDYIDTFVKYYHNVVPTALETYAKKPVNREKLCTSVRLADLPSCNLMESDDDEDDRTEVRTRIEKGYLNLGTRRKKEK